MYLLRFWKINRNIALAQQSQLCDKIKTESTRKLSNFNFQWTKALYQNNLKNIVFFFTFQGLKM